MSGVRVSSLWVKHLLCIPVIGSHTQHVASFFTRIIDCLDGFVCGANGNDSSVINTSVSNLRHRINKGANVRKRTYHIRRGKVAHDKVKFAALDNLGNLVCDILHAHFGLFVIGCNLW
jgi:hypothetical protein